MSQAFSIIHEKQSLVGMQDIMTVNPMMDLLALSGSTGLSIVRFLSWQRLPLTFKNEPSETNFTSVAWKGDGQVIATGTSDGKILLFKLDGSRGLKFEKKLGTAPIIGIEWTRDLMEHKSLYVDLTKHFYPFLEFKDSTGTNQRVSFDEPLGGLDLLTTLDAQGIVTISVAGSFLIARIDIRQFVSGTPQQVWISSNHKVLCVIIKSGQQSMLLRLGLGLIGESANELEILAHHIGAVRLLETRLGEGLHLLQQRWRDLDSQISEKFKKKLAEKCQAHGADSYESQLLDCLIGGVQGPALEQFLQNTVPEVQMRKLRKGCQASLQEMTDQTTQLSLAMEAFIFRLTQLDALARWRERFAALGWQEKSSQLLLELARSVFFELQLLSDRLRDMGTRLSFFFEWIAVLQQSERKLLLDDLQTIEFITHDLAGLGSLKVLESFKILQQSLGKLYEAPLHEAVPIKEHDVSVLGPSDLHSFSFLNLEPDVHCLIFVQGQHVCINKFSSCQTLRKSGFELDRPIRQAAFYSAEYVAVLLDMPDFSSQFCLYQYDGVLFKARSLDFKAESFVVSSSRRVAALRYSSKKLALLDLEGEEEEEEEKEGDEEEEEEEKEENQGEKEESD